LKKLIAIPLLAIYLFNLVGYSLYTNYFISQSDKKIVQQIDNNTFDESELIELKTPINLPYYNDTKEYQPMDGEMVLNGVHYNYVKRKIHNDTLYVLCLPNMAKTTLQKQKDSYANQANDLPANNKENAGTKKNAFSNEYVGQVFQYSFNVPPIKTALVFSNHLYNITKGYLMLQYQPPEKFC
jgi:hypothetical protein